jgi:thioesterase DpgC
MYRRLTDDYRLSLRVDELVWKAAELWPGLLPAKQDVERERDRMQMDKDGLEIQQGVFLEQVMAEPRAGNHLIVCMLRPKPESLELLASLRERGEIDLGGARVEVKGGIGHVTCSNPRFLNAEDDESVAAQETAIDLVLLHPGVQLCVLRGGAVDHPRYRGRRVFDSGINLTKLYHGKIGFVSFYLVRDLGLVNKIYRGLALDGWPGGDEPETTLEKPWVAAVDAFAIGGGCQLLLVMDYVIAESGSYCNLPARKEGIIPGAANLRLPRFMGDRRAREAILFDRTFHVGRPEAEALVNEVAPRDGMDEAVERAAANALGSGMVSAGGNRKALRVQQEPIDTFRRYLATYCAEQALCHLSSELIANLEKHWRAKERAL